MSSTRVEAGTGDAGEEEERSQTADRIVKSSAENRAGVCRDNVNGTSRRERARRRD